ncbi:MAG TPA: hypothetical protein VG871_00890, partial [Vicinamibacterales bacterium]|nr:hypothetical protein [Vicinamibacterales bacterium]
MNFPSVKTPIVPTREKLTRFYRVAVKFIALRRQIPPALTPTLLAAVRTSDCSSFDNSGRIT